MAKFNLDNYETVELLVDIIKNDMKKPDAVEINGVFKEVNKVGTRREQ